jgi:hypothetical protein
MVLQNKQIASAERTEDHEKQIEAFKENSWLLRHKVWQQEQHLLTFPEKAGSLLYSWNDSRQNAVKYSISQSTIRHYDYRETEKHDWLAKLMASSLLANL